jgi:hypothetical protein
MTENPAHDDIGTNLRWRLLIPDNTPLSLLGLLGVDALDWLFVPGAEVWVTDMVREEALRDPDPGDDRRAEHRAIISDWFNRNRHRIRIQSTAEGLEYKKAMEVWRRAGSPPELKPSWSARGERSILQVLGSVEKILADGEVVVTLVDDRKARAAIRAMEGTDIDLMATETFVEWLHQRFHVAKATTAWSIIKVAANNRIPSAPEEDPVHIRKIG